MGVTELTSEIGDAGTAGLDGTGSKDLGRINSGEGEAGEAGVWSYKVGYPKKASLIRAEKWTFEKS